MKKILLCNCLVLLLFIVPGFGQESHVLKGELEAKSSINIQHRRGALRVLPATGNTVSWEARLTFESPDAASTQQLLDAYKISENVSANELNIDSQLKIKRYNIINGRSKIYLENGEVIKGIKKLKIDLTVYIPSTPNVKVSNKYQPITIEADITDKLEIQAYECEVTTKDIKGDLDMNSKYSKGQIGAAQNIRIELYESKHDFGNAKEVEINAKYSTIKFQNLASLKGSSYENKIYGQTISGELSLTEKYSDMEFKKIGSGKGVFYETDLKVEEVGDLELQSKYSDYDFRTVGSLEFRSSYEDDVEVVNLEHLISPASKYTTYTITGSLAKSVEFGTSYEDKIRVGSVASSFESFQVGEGKYTKVDCVLPKNLSYEMQVDNRYTKFDGSAFRLDYAKYNQKGDQIQFTGTSKNSSGRVVSVEMKCYDCNLNL